MKFVGWDRDDGLVDVLRRPETHNNTWENVWSKIQELPHPAEKAVTGPGVGCEVPEQ